MNETGTIDLSGMAADCRELIVSKKTLLLATASKDGAPDISYAPYVRDPSGRFYIYVSELAAHTVNLMNNPQASILFIHPESESANLFARERAVFGCSVDEVSGDDDNYNQQLQALQKKFGEVVSVLRSLPDFHLFELTPTKGQYVVGFGRAFSIDVEDGSLSPIGGAGSENRPL